MRHAALFLSLSLGVFSVGASAGSSAGLFNVDISVRSAPEVCVSQSVNEATAASVTVMCSSSQFVNIGAAAEPQLLGTPHRALRYRHGGKLPLFAGLPSRMAEIGTGTVTSYRWVRANGTDYPDDVIEMLVDF